MRDSHWSRKKDPAMIYYPNNNFSSELINLLMEKLFNLESFKFKFNLKPYREKNVNKNSLTTDSEYYFDNLYISKQKRITWYNLYNLRSRLMNEITEKKHSTQK